MHIVRNTQHIIVKHAIDQRLACSIHHWLSSCRHSWLNGTNFWHNERTLHSRQQDMCSSMLRYKVMRVRMLGSGSIGGRYARISSSPLDGLEVSRCPGSLQGLGSVRLGSGECRESRHPLNHRTS